MAIDPCSICGSAARVEQREHPRRLGEATARTTDVRVCTSPECPSNTGNRRLGDAV